MIFRNIRAEIVSLRSKRSRANEVLCVARVKILVARKLGREQKRKRSRAGAGQQGTTSGGSPQFQNGFSGKLLFHLTFNRNFRSFWLNGKHPGTPLFPFGTERRKFPYPAFARFPSSSLPSAENNNRKPNFKW